MELYAELTRSAAEAICECRRMWYILRGALDADSFLRIGFAPVGKFHTYSVKVGCIRGRVRRCGRA